jgi:uncharacterized protein YjbI with pentapeptide repeats
MKPDQLKKVIDYHKKWILGTPDGRRADLGGADLGGADLRGADLGDANLDFSCLPLWCGSFRLKADDRLVSQLFAHIARLDVSGCSPHVRYRVKQLRESDMANAFCKYRGDVAEI